MGITKEELAAKISAGHEQLDQLAQDISARQRAALILQGKIIAWSEMLQEFAEKEKEKDDASNASSVGNAGTESS